MSETSDAPQAADRAVLAALLATGTSLSAVTAVLYTIGLAYTESFYQNLGFPGSRALDFKVQDYVIRSYNPVASAFGETSWIMVGCLGAILIGLHRVPYWSHIVPTFVASILLIWPSQDFGYWPTRIFAVVALAYAVSRTSWETRYRSAAYVTLLLVAWGVLVYSSALLGVTEVCQLAAEPSRAQNVRITTKDLLIRTESPLIESSQIDDRWVITGLRVVSRTPAGLVAFPAEASPFDGVLLLPVQDDDALQFWSDPARITRPVKSRDCSSLLK